MNNSNTTRALSDHGNPDHYTRFPKLCLEVLATVSDKEIDEQFGACLIDGSGVVTLRCLEAEGRS